MTEDPACADHDRPTRPRFVVDVGGGEAPTVFDGRYEVGGLLGIGATAKVYRGYDRRLDREVAVKVFNHDAVEIEQRRRVREAGIHGSVDHPGVVALLDSGTDAGRMYLVMEFVAGENLAERLLGGPLSPARVTELATRLTDALAHLHACGITHRDLKPGNILLGASGPLVADFGIAQAPDLTRVTATGTVVGTAAYLAPEQVVGDPVGPPADVYALGLILLECLTGELEYPGTATETALARLSRSPRVPAGLPVELSTLIERMTAREPVARPSSAAVHAALTGEAPLTAPIAVPAWAPGSPPAAETAVVPWKFRTSKKTRVAAGTALALGAVALFVPLVLGGASSSEVPPPDAQPGTSSPVGVGAPPTITTTVHVAEQPLAPAGDTTPAHLAPPAAAGPPPEHAPKKDIHPGKGKGPQHR
ncbi:protein kinase [Amycolatopsis rhabdoformis]|uniref:non-specific serine/threonine protein kinase n=1 Tax=Amycolatopsis rhabdoformis TaxID=1448059 RepID=A0ABZ1IJM1_9PSEU|nr:protein kinase [Amycolatopsis rhabdoformis]WSE34664.1 protein kinase [Amycolatopsis rhabdoformis]